MNILLSIMLCAAMIFPFSAASLFAQIELEQTIPGKPVQKFLLDIIGLQSPDRMDFTGDGKPDITFFKTDPQGNISLAIVDAADYTVWRLIQLKGEIDVNIPNTNGLKATVIGSSELDGNKNFKEIILAEKSGRRYVNPIVIDVEGAVLWDGTSKTLLGIAQMDGDICEEIMVADPTVPQVEVYGKKDSTNINSPSFTKP